MDKFNLILNIFYILMFLLFAPIILEMRWFFWDAFREWNNTGIWVTTIKFDYFPGEPWINMVWYHISIIFLFIGIGLFGMKMMKDFKDK